MDRVDENSLETWTIKEILVNKEGRQLRKTNYIGRIPFWKSYFNCLFVEMKP